MAGDEVVEDQTKLTPPRFMGVTLAELMQGKQHDQLEADASERGSPRREEQAADCAYGPSHYFFVACGNSETDLDNRHSPDFLPSPEIAFETPGSFGRVPAAVDE